MSRWTTAPRSARRARRRLAGARRIVQHADQANQQPLFLYAASTCTLLCAFTTLSGILLE